MVRLDSLCEAVNVGHVGPSSMHRDPSGIPFLMGKNVGEGQLLLRGCERVKHSFHESQPKSRLRPGDVVVVRIGKSGQAAKIPNSLGEANCSGLVIVKQPHSVDPDYLVYYLNSPQGRAYAHSQARGSTRLTLNTSSVAAALVPLPPLPEQRRIVAILDQAFEGIATAKANAERNLRNAREVFESQLSLLFTQEVNRWPERRMSDVCREITVGHVGAMKGEYRETGVPFLRSQNIRPFEVTLENVVYVSQRFHQSLKKSILRPGDLATVRTGYPGTTAVVPESLPEANCSDLVIMRVGESVDPNYIAAFLNSSYGRHLVGSQLVGAAQKHFNVTAAKQVALRVPPLPEQARVVERVMQVRNQLQACEVILTRKEAALDELKASLLHQAFTGAL
jgi:type I restriction enzyme S subunit